MDVDQEKSLAQNRYEKGVLSGLFTRGQFDVYSRSSWNHSYFVANVKQVAKVIDTKCILEGVECNSKHHL